MLNPYECIMAGCYDPAIRFEYYMSDQRARGYCQECYDRFVTDFNQDPNGSHYEIAKNEYETYLVVES